MKQRKNFIPISEAKNLKLLCLPDCIYLSDNCGCAVLHVTDCLGVGCPFRRAYSEYRSARSSWRRRLCSLTLGTQEKIAAVYYDGSMPWKERGERGT